MDASWTVAMEAEAINILQEESSAFKNRRYYHIRQNFELVEIGGLRRVRRKRGGKLMATTESWNDIIRDVHVAINHRGETKTHKKIQEDYSNIPKIAVRKWISNCERCAEKSKKRCARGVGIRPILASSLNNRGQVNLVDYQSLPDGDFRFVMHYEEHLTRYSFFRPLMSKMAAEVAKELFHIFLDFGAPCILQSDKEREFTADIIRELGALWPDLFLINGVPQYPQSQGSDANEPLKDVLVAWMRDNKTTKWSQGLPFVQWGMNSTYLEAIKMSPYEAMFGQKARTGITASIPRKFLTRMNHGMMEEEFLDLLTPFSEGDSDVDDSSNSEVPYPPIRAHLLSELV